LLIGPRPLADDRPLGSVLLEQRHQIRPARFSGFGLQLALSTCTRARTVGWLRCSEGLGQIERLSKREVLYRPLAAQRSETTFR
jgi:hypothetical protein